MQSIRILPGEYWYTATSAYGSVFPLGEDGEGRFSLRNNATMNQMVSALFSSKGRYLYAEEGFDAAFGKGTITLADGCPALYKAGCCLRDACADFLRRFDRGAGSPFILSPDFVTRRVYNTWIELTYWQNQRDVLSYAHSLLDEGFAPGTLMIDDGWSLDYGDWRFHPERFPDPRAMLDELHAMGFRVMLWLVPYLSPDSLVARTLYEKGLLLMNGEEPHIVKWWNGYSAALDLRLDGAVQWLREQMEALKRLGVDGFKFDGGDSCSYLVPHEPDRQSHLWAALAAEQPFNEIRADYNTQGMSIMERLSDKRHAWGKGGVADLMPATLALGLGGHPVSSPDMIGGGEFRSFSGLGPDDLDKELLLKNTAIAAMMPAVQFSLNPARVWPEGVPAILSLLAQRDRHAALYERLFVEASKSKQPIIRYMEYVFPHQGMETVTDQFMVGDRLLVAPLYEKGQNSRSVLLPAGRWRDGDGSIVGDPKRLLRIESQALLGIWQKVD